MFFTKSYYQARCQNSSDIHNEKMWTFRLEKVASKEMTVANGFVCN